MKNWKKAVAAPATAVLLVAGTAVPAAAAPAEPTGANQVVASSENADIAAWTAIDGDAQKDAAQPTTGSGTDDLSKRCTNTLTGWGIAGAVLIPIAILNQVGFPPVATVFGVARYVIQQATAVVQLRLGDSNPALADFAALSSQQAPLIVALALGATAVATTASACAR